MALGVKLYWHT